MSAWPIRLLVLGNIALVAVLGRQWLDDAGDVREVRWAPPTPVQPVLATVSLRLAEPGTLSPLTVAALAERPLFHPTRRPLPPPPPPPPAQVVAPPPPPDPLDFTVVQGVVAGDAGVVLARVQGTARRLSVGQKVGDWELTAVAPEAVTFTRNGTQRELRLALSTFGSPKPAPVPVPVATVPSAGASAAAPARGGSLAEAGREEQLEILRRRNEIRAQRGLPPVPQ